MSEIGSSSKRGILTTPDKAAPSRWRKTNHQRHMRNKRKLKRNLGHEYVTKRHKTVSAREIGLPCTCKRKCREMLKGKHMQIFNAFWDLADYDKQNIYLFSQMKSIPKKRTYPKKTKRGESSRKLSLQYFVKVNGTDIKVCKQEFLAVHGLQNSKKKNSTVV